MRIEMGSKSTLVTAAVGVATVALLGAAPAHADEYGLTPDYRCTVTRHGSTDATISKQSCIDAFLYAAHVDNLISRPKFSSSDTQLVSDGVIACLNGSANIDVVAAAVRRFDGTLAGGKPVMGGNEDVSAANLAWVAVGTLCAGGVT